MNTETLSKKDLPLLMKQLPSLLAELEAHDRESLSDLVATESYKLRDPTGYAESLRIMEDTSRWFYSPEDVCGFTDEQKAWLKSKGASISTSYYLTYKVAIKADPEKWKYGFYYGTGINAVLEPCPDDIPVGKTYIRINWPATVAKMRRWIKYAMENDDLENPERFEDDLRELPAGQVTP